MPRRCAYTLIEMMVVIGIIGILATLLSVAVQASRESMRRAHCLGNLRQIGLAMQSYMSRDGMLPSAMMKIDGESPRFFSAFTHILPELDQAATFDNLNFAAQQAMGPQAGTSNATVAATRMDIFLCLSDGATEVSSLGPNNYRINMGSSSLSFPRKYEAEASGPFALEEWIRPQQVSDGLSNTALVSERLIGSGGTNYGDLSRDYWLSGLPGKRLTTHEMIRRCAGVPAGMAPHFAFSGSTWLVYGYDQTLYNHVTSPNSPGPDCVPNDEFYGGRGGADAGIFAARSSHRGGINLITADGSGHWVSDTTDLAIWRALGTRAGREVVPAILR